jgi:hypothetical protein
MTDRGTWKKDFPPKTLKSRLLCCIREMIQGRLTSLHGARPLCSGALSPSLSPQSVACFLRDCPQAERVDWHPRGHPSPGLLALFTSLDNFWGWREGRSRKSGHLQMPHLVPEGPGEWVWPLSTMGLRKGRLGEEETLEEDTEGGSALPGNNTS